MKSFNIKALALTSGFTYGLCLLLLAWFAAYGWGERVVDLMASFYTGYEATFFGGIVGAIWGFILGVIFGAIFGYIYNYCSKKCKS